MKSEGHIISARWDGAVDFSHSLPVSNLSWTLALFGAYGRCSGKKLFVFANNFSSLTHPMLLQCGLQSARLKIEMNLHLPKDSAAVDYQHLDFLKVPDDSR